MSRSMMARGKTPKSVLNNTFEHGADPNARASGGETAMDSAIKAHKESLKGEGAAPEFQGIDEANCLAVGNMLVNRGFVRPEL